MKIDSGTLFATLFLLITGFQSIAAQQPRGKPAAAGPQPSLPIVRQYGRSGVKLSIADHQVVLNLRGDFEGCLDLYDSMDKHRTETKIAAEINVVDKASKEGKYYVVLLIGAEGNCNIQGVCGAATIYTLIWLQMSESLKLEKKQPIVVENCRTSLIESSHDTENPRWRLKPIKGKLSLEFSIPDPEKQETLIVTQLLYEHRVPEKGLVTTVSKKPKE